MNTDVAARRIENRWEAQKVFDALQGRKNGPLVFWQGRDLTVDGVDGIGLSMCERIEVRERRTMSPS